MAEIFETNNPAVAEQVLSSAYATMRVDTRGQRGGVKISRAPLGPSARLDRNRFLMSFDVTGTPLGVLTIGQLRGGQAAYRAGGHERRYRPGDVFFAVQPELPYAVISVNADIEVAVIEPSLLSQVADAAPGRTQEPVRFTGYGPVSLPAAQVWKDTCAFVRATVLDNPEAVAQPLIAGSAARLLAAVALATFASNAVTDPTAGDRHDAHGDTLRRAIAFIEEHADQDITVGGMAQAAHVTVRAVQLAFRRHLDLTPMQYLRRVRLGHAHHDLVAADPATTSVTAVAYRWGFASSSRFATVYRQAYGVNPSRTLHQN
jgi:AraC-like DNA-binding protein